MMALVECLFSRFFNFIPEYSSYVIINFFMSKLPVKKQFLSVISNLEISIFEHTDVSDDVFILSYM